MKKRVLAFSLLLIGSASWSYFSADGNLYSESTGSPVSTSCTACHGGSNNSDPGLTLVVTDTATLQTVSAYVPGKTYNVAVSMSKPGINKFGFALSTSKGTLKKINSSTTTQMKAAGYATHTSSGTTAISGVISWNVLWTAPASGTADLLVYVNATNGDGTVGGDMIYTMQKSLNALSSGLPDLAALSGIEVYPQPAAGQLNFTYNLVQGNSIKLALYDFSGKTIADMHTDNLVAGKGNMSLSTENLERGMYILVAELNGQTITRKVLLQ